MLLILLSRRSRRRGNRPSIILLGRGVLRSIWRLLVTLRRERWRIVRALGITLGMLGSTRGTRISLGSTRGWRRTRSRWHRRRMKLLAWSWRWRIRRLGRRGMLGRISRLAIRSRHDCRWSSRTEAESRSEGEDRMDGREVKRVARYVEVTQGGFHSTAEIRGGMLTEPAAGGGEPG